MKVGDRVKIISCIAGDSDIFHGKHGVIIESYDTAFVRWTVKTDDGLDGSFFEEELELVND